MVSHTSDVVIVEASAHRERAQRNEGDMIMDDSLLTPAEAALIAGMTTAALAQLRYLGKGPDFYRLGPRTIRYARSEFVEWIRQSRTTASGR